MALCPFSYFKKYMKYVFLILLCTFVVNASGQSKVDLELKVQTASETARGGESFSYLVTVGNRGTQKATDVVVANWPEDFVRIVSGTSSQGKCDFSDPDNKSRMHCEIGNLSPGETVTINFETKIGDFDYPDPGGIGTGRGGGLGEPGKSEPPAVGLIPVQGKAKSDDSDSHKSSLGTLWLRADEESLDRNNDHADILVKLLPSLNRAPQVRIVTPKDRETLIRPAGSQIDFVVNIEASDVDGRVVKVRVDDPVHCPRPVGMDEKGYKFEYDGVVYSATELAEYLKKNPPLERVATATGKNTFAYTMTDPPYGPNYLSVVVVDDGGRESHASVTFFVKSDSTIEIVSPKRDQIIAPGSTVTVETISRLKSGRLKEVYISGDGIAVNPQEGLVKMELVSSQGNVYRHRFVVKDIPANSVYSNLNVVLVEDSGGYTDAGVGFLVRKMPRFAFTSIRDGETLQKAERILIACSIENRSSNDEYILYVDGKSYSTLYSDSIYWLSPDIGTHAIQIVATFAKVELTKSPLITVHVK